MCVCVCVCVTFLSVLLVPCVPEQLEGNVDCESGEVAVSWERSFGATSYTAMVEGGAGYAPVCDSNSTVCVFRDLLCGVSYSISVSASDGTCSSPYSSTIQLDTGKTNAHIRIYTYNRTWAYTQADICTEMDTRTDTKQGTLKLMQLKFTNPLNLSKLSILHHFRNLTSSRASK